MQRSVGILFLGLFFSLPVQALPISAGVWYEFSFFDVDLPAMGCAPADPDATECVPGSGTPTVFAPAPPWIFSFGVGNAALIVTDVALYGDAFRILNDGAELGLTSLPGPADFASCGDDPMPCLRDPLSSSGRFLLAPGSHSFEILPYASPYGAGSAYFRIELIPEPNGLLLACTAALAAWSVRRRVLS